MNDPLGNKVDNFRITTFKNHSYHFHCLLIHQQEHCFINCFTMKKCLLELILLSQVYLTKDHLHFIFLLYQRYFNPMDLNSFNQSFVNLVLFEVYLHFLISHRDHRDHLDQNRPLIYYYQQVERHFFFDFLTYLEKLDHLNHLQCYLQLVT